MQRYYWIRFGKFLAGEYPISIYDQDPNCLLRELIDIGITYFLDLTEKNEKNLPQYLTLLKQIASMQALTVQHKRIPVPDFGVPSVECMTKILRTVHNALKSRKLVYVHCFAGLGRTATVAGCYFVEQGMDGDEALQEIERIQQGTCFGGSVSPITDEQRQMVKDWVEYRGNSNVTEDR